MLPYTYNLNDDSDRQGLAADNSKAFETHFPVKNIPIGLNMLDMYGDYLRLRSGIYGNEPVVDKYGIKPVDDKYQTFKTTVYMNMEAQGDNITLVSAGCTWLDVSKWDSQFQFGRHTATTHLSFLGRGQPESIDVKFDRPYGQVPKVVVWLHSLDMTVKIGIKTYTSDVTTTGFKLWFEAPGQTDDVTYESAFRVSWVAVPQNWPNVTAGSFEFSYDGGHILDSKTEITFDKPFQRAPRVLVALSGVRTTGENGLRIETKAENVTAQGMTLSVKSWDGSHISLASAQYIAIVD